MLPLCTSFNLEIGSSLLMNALYLPTCKHIGLFGTAVVRPLPNIHDIAPLELDLGYYFPDAASFRSDEAETGRPTTTLSPHVYYHYHRS
jgi:hypothetical protein